MLRRRSVRRNAIVVVFALLSWLAVDALFSVFGIEYSILALFPVVLIGARALVRCLAGLSGNAHNPYVSIPYDPRSFWKRTRLG